MAEPLVNLYNTWAHVFQINTETKNSWLPKGDSAIPISFVANESQTSRRELRLIGTGENGDTVLDSVISPRTVFAKRSQKFCQYFDNNGMIWGLGFNCEAELNEFIETFQQLQRDLMAPESVAPSLPPTARQESQPHMNLQTVQGAAPAATSAQSADRVDGWNKTQPSTNTTSEMNGRDLNTTTEKSHDRYSLMGASTTAATQYTNSHPRNQQVRRQQMSTNDTSEHDNNNNNGLNGNGNSNDHEAHYPRSQSMFGMQQKQMTTGSRTTPENEISPLSQSDSKVKEQLKYENERLKQALEESSKNAGVWQNELLNLRTNNAKLTQALQESKAHVGEWEKELMSLRDENKELKLRVMALESADDPEKTNEYKIELEKYKHYIDEVQKELNRKESEVEDLQRAMEKLEVKANSNGAQNGRSDDPTSVEVAISSYQKQKFDSINAKLEAKISELYNIQREYAQLADKLYH